MNKLLITGYLIALFFTPSSIAQRTVGLLQIDTTKANIGYTLFAPLNSNKTYLIDRCGLEVNNWTSNYAPGISAILTPDGNLLRTAYVPHKYAMGGAGGRMELFNWKGEMIWEFNSNSDSFTTHHDIMLLPNGHILAIAVERMGMTELDENGFDTSMFERDGRLMDYLIEIEMVGNNQGKIVWEWHVKDHLVQDKFSGKKNYGVVADHPELVNINFGDAFNGYDWLHINSVDYNTEFNQIMMSPLNFNEIWVIEYNGNTADAKSHDKGKYAKGGDLLYRWGNPETYDRGNALDRMIYHTHDPHWIKAGLKDAGKIMFFHNGVQRPGGNYSSVDIISPPVNSSGEYSLGTGIAYEPTTVSWTYSAPTKSDLFSTNLSSAARLPNGNTFITSGGQGRFFEIDANKKIVWQYINPVGPNGPVNQGDVTPTSSVFKGIKYQPDFKGFEKVSVMGKDPIELNPIASLCKKANEIPPVCNFTASKQNMEVNVETTLTDISTGSGITGRKWSITSQATGSSDVIVVSGDTNSSAVVTLKFAAKGLYTVSLLVSNAFGYDSKTKTDYINVTKTDGIHQISNQSQLRVYPNPTKGTITVHGIDFELNGAQIILKDILGRELVHVLNMNGTALLELGKLSAGIYELNVIQDGNLFHQKIQIE